MLLETSKYISVWSCNSKWVPLYLWPLIYSDSYRLRLKRCPPMCCDMCRFIEAHGFWQWHLILGSSGNLCTPSYTSTGRQLVTAGPQTQRDLLAYCNPSGSELPKPGSHSVTGRAGDPGPGTENRESARKEEHNYCSDMKEPKQREWWRQASGWPKS